jgi:hypothetical protein
MSKIQQYDLHQDNYGAEMTPSSDGYYVTADDHQASLVTAIDCEVETLVLSLTISGNMWFMDATLRRIQTLRGDRSTLVRQANSMRFSDYN